MFELSYRDLAWVLSVGYATIGVQLALRSRGKGKAQGQPEPYGITWLMYIVFWPVVALWGATF